MKAARKPQGPLGHWKHLWSQSRSSITSHHVWWNLIRSYTTTEGDAALRFHPTVPMEETEQEERPQAQEWLPHQCKHAAVFAWNPLLILPLLCDCLKSKANINKFPGPVTKRRFRTKLGQHRSKEVSQQPETRARSSLTKPRLHFPPGQGLTCWVLFLWHTEQGINFCFF